MACNGFLTYHAIRWPIILRFTFHTCRYCVVRTDIKSANISNDSLSESEILAHGVRYGLPAYDSIPGSRVRPPFSGHDSAGPVVVSFRRSCHHDNSATMTSQL